MVERTNAIAALVRLLGGYSMTIRPEGMRWQVVLTSTHAACAYKGKTQRTMRAAYNAARKKAAMQFLAYRAAICPHRDLDWRNQWGSVFESAARAMRHSRYSRVEDSWKGLYVSIARVLA